MSRFIYYYEARASCLTLVNSQKVSGENVSAVFGTNATLKWNITKSNGFNDVPGLKVFRGKRRNKNSLLLEHTTVKPYGEKIFNSRLSGKPTGDTDAYVVTITDVRYNDNGFYNFEALFEESLDNTTRRNATIKLSVNGKPSVFFSISGIRGWGEGRVKKRDVFFKFFSKIY